MSVVHAVGTTILNRLRMATDAGAVTPAAGTSVDAGSSFGTLTLGLSTLSGTTGVICNITLQKPSFSYSGSAATMLGVPLNGTATASAAANAIVKAELRDSSANTIISGLVVGSAAGDIIIPGTSAIVSSGQTITITSAVITGT
jgi:hypothetical protein